MTYSILLHKTYRVPVLYLESNLPLSGDHSVYSSLVSPEFLPALQNVGVMGGLTPSVSLTSLILITLKESFS